MTHAHDVDGIDGVDIIDAAATSKGATCDERGGETQHAMSIARACASTPSSECAFTPSSSTRAPSRTDSTRMPMWTSSGSRPMSVHAHASPRPARGGSPVAASNDETIASPSSRAIINTTASSPSRAHTHSSVDASSSRDHHDFASHISKRRRVTSPLVKTKLRGATTDPHGHDVDDDDMATTTHHKRVMQSGDDVDASDIHDATRNEEEVKSPDDAASVGDDESAHAVANADESHDVCDGEHDADVVSTSHPRPRLSPFERCFTDGVHVIASHLTLSEWLPAVCTCHILYATSSREPRRGLTFRYVYIEPDQNQPSLLKSLSTSPLRHHVTEVIRDQHVTRAAMMVYMRQLDIDLLARLTSLRHLRFLVQREANLSSLRSLTALTYLKIAFLPKHSDDHGDVQCANESSALLQQLRSIRCLTSLRQLYIDDVAMTADEFAILFDVNKSRLGQLERISMMRTRFTVGHFEHLMIAADALRHIAYDYINHDAVSMVQHFTHVDYLSFAHADSWSGATAEQLTQCTHITSLLVCGVTITSSDMMMLLTAMQLTELSLVNMVVPCTSFTESVTYASQSRPSREISLRKLTLIDCSPLTLDDIHSISSLPIERLFMDTSTTRNVFTASLEELRDINSPSYMPKLQHLNY